ncbi:MAG: RcnB family protein [Sphingomonadaceae bacterium]
MRSLAFTSIALAALTVANPALAGHDSELGAPPVVVTPAPPMRAMPAIATPVAQPAVYVRPGYGFQLPREWMTPDHFIADPRRHGLERPAAGFGWSRYHDDMVLTDQWGRVYAARIGDGRADATDGRRRSRDTDGVAGGVAGAAVGAVAGNLIAGTGSRLAGSLIGGGVGALIGLGVELATKRGARDRDSAQDFDDGERIYGAHWSDVRPELLAHDHDCGCVETVTTTTYPAATMVRQVVYRDVLVRMRPAKIMARVPAADAPRRTIKYTRRIGQ